MNISKMISDFEEHKKALLDKLYELDDRWEMMFDYMIEKELIYEWNFYDMCNMFGLNGYETEKMYKKVFG